MITLHEMKLEMDRASGKRFSLALYSTHTHTPFLFLSFLSFLHSVPNISSEYSVHAEWNDTKIASALSIVFRNKYSCLQIHYDEKTLEWDELNRALFDRMEQKLQEGDEPLRFGIDDILDAVSLERLCWNKDCRLSCVWSSPARCRSSRSPCSPTPSWLRSSRLSKSTASALLGHTACSSSSLTSNWLVNWTI